MSKRTAFSINLIAIGVLSLGLWGCGFGDVARDKPYEVTGEDLDQAIQALPPDIGLLFSGVEFFGESLFVSSNVGVFEIAADGSLSLFKWNNYDDVLSGPWNDRSANRLWFRHEASADFATFDGREWRTIGLPMPEPTRGDLLHGFNGLTNKDGFWIQAASREGWRWNEESSEWRLISLPEVKCRDYYDGTDTYSCLASIAPTDSREFVIMHGEFISPSTDVRNSKADRPAPDRVFFREGMDWKEVERSDDPDFVTETVVTTPSTVYIRSHYGPYFRVDENGIQSIGSPGRGGAFTETSEGGLIVSVPRIGIFEYRDGWVKIYDCPYPPDYPVAFEYLAESNGKIAFAAVPDPSDTHGYGAKSRLWTLIGKDLVERTIP